MEAITTASNPNEFQNLCYLLTCKCVADSPSFVGWNGVMTGREKLADDLTRSLEAECGVSSAYTTASSNFSNSNKLLLSTSNQEQDVPDNRLITLLQQAVAYQMEFKRYHPKIVPQTVCWVGNSGDYIAAAGADCKISIWSSNPGSSDRNNNINNSSYHKDSTNNDDHSVNHRDLYSHSDHDDDTNDTAIHSSNGQLSSTAEYDTGYGRTSTPVAWLIGHSNIIWDVNSNTQGTQLISASGDSSIKIWQLDSEQLAAKYTSNTETNTNTTDNDDDTYSSSSCVRTSTYESASIDSTQTSIAAVATLTGHSSDVYSVKYYPDECHVVSGSHDRTVKLWDISTTTEMKTFTGHDAGVLHVTTNKHGNLLISGSRDSTIKFWDVMSGVCVRTYNQLNGCMCDCPFHQAYALPKLLHDHITSSHTTKQPLGAVTSVEMSSDGIHLLSSTRHGPIRIWDMRYSEQPLPQRYKGHESTCSSSFIKATFCGDESIIVGGSDSGVVYMWDRKTANIIQQWTSHIECRVLKTFSTALYSTVPDSMLFCICCRVKTDAVQSDDVSNMNMLHHFVIVIDYGKYYHIYQKLHGHSGAVYSGHWNESQSLLATCGNDATVRTWWYKDSITDNKVTPTAAAVAVDKHEATTQYDAPHDVTNSANDQHENNSGDTNGVESVTDSVISTAAEHSHLSSSNGSTTDSIDALAIDAMISQQQSIAIALLNADAE
eukprot:9085-Heterococcus_DN1.PRE.2